MSAKGRVSVLASAFWALVLGRTFFAYAATDVWSPHIAAGEWRTTISLYNATSQTVPVQLAKFASDGQPLEPAKQFTAPARDWLVISPNELNFDGTAHLTSAGDLLVKMSYQYLDSHSLCEFYLSSATNSDWVIPNTVRDWYTWTGVALMNPSDSPTQVELKAYRNRIEIGSHSIQLLPQQKFAALSQDIWPGFMYRDFDTILNKLKSADPSSHQRSGRRCAATPSLLHGPDPAGLGQDPACLGGAHRHRRLAHVNVAVQQRQRGRSV
jgi:hypothetical protein